MSGSISSICVGNELYVCVCDAVVAVGDNWLLQWRNDLNCRGVRMGPAHPAAAGPIIWQARIFTLYQFSRTWVDSSRIYAVRRQILMLKCTKFDFRWGFAPDPLAGFKAPTSKGGENGGKGKDGEWRKKWGPYYYERERMKWIGGREGKRKGFAGPMSNCFLRRWTVSSGTLNLAQPTNHDSCNDRFVGAFLTAGRRRTLMTTVWWCC